MTKMAMANTPIYDKDPLKTFFSGTKGPMILRLGMQHWGLEPNKVCSNDDLGMTLILARSNLLSYAFYMEKYTFFLQKKNVRKLFNRRKLQQMTEVTRCVC